MLVGPRLLVSALMSRSWAAGRVLGHPLTARFVPLHQPLTLSDGRVLTRLVLDCTGISPQPFHVCSSTSPTQPGMFAFRLLDHPALLKQKCCRCTERECFYYIIEQTYDVGLHSRRHPNLSLYVHLIVCHIYIYSLPLFIQWFQFIHDISTVCLHFTCESGCVGLRACLRSGLLQVWCGIACFPVSVCALVELWRV